MGEQDKEGQSVDDTIVLSAEEIKKMLKEVPDEKPKEEGDDAGS
jgi:hypothetical protein